LGERLNDIVNIDRLQPSRRPSGRTVGLQSWRQLLFAHWPVAAEAVQPLLPTGLTLDTYQGVAYVGLVPFAMRSVRRPGVPSWAGLSFLETNLRTYVHVDGRDPGVYFFSLDASSRLAVAVARRRVGLPYFLARMRSIVQAGEVTYALRRLSPSPARLYVRYRVGPLIGPSNPGTLEHFLLERYLLHVPRAGALWTLQVHHPPYPARAAQVVEVREDLFAAAGLPAVTGLPPIAHFASGVDVEIFPPWARQS
jgi:uncharacterized protein YqjF (DUF2071 family)